MKIDEEEYLGDQRTIASLRSNLSAKDKILNDLDSFYSELRQEKDRLTRELAEARDQVHRARTLWCDSKRDPETGAVHIRYVDEFEAAIKGQP